MARALLLDEMLSGAIAGQLRAGGHDVVAVVEDSALVGLPDGEVLGAAAGAGRGLVTVNIKDFIVLDRHYRASGRTHSGIDLLSARTFPQDRGFVGAVVGALGRLLDGDKPAPGAVTFLPR